MQVQQNAVVARHGHVLGSDHMHRNAFDGLVLDVDGADLEPLFFGAGGVRVGTLASLFEGLLRALVGLGATEALLRFWAEIIGHWNHSSDVRGAFFVDVTGVALRGFSSSGGLWGGGRIGRRLLREHGGNGKDKNGGEDFREHQSVSSWSRSIVA